MFLQLSKELFQLGSHFHSFLKVGILTTEVVISCFHILGGMSKRDETLRVDNSWHGDHESDTESLDNEIDDPLR